MTLVSFAFLNQTCYLTGPPSSTGPPASTASNPLVPKSDKVEETNAGCFFLREHKREASSWHYGIRSCFDNALAFQCLDGKTRTVLLCSSPADLFHQIFTASLRLFACQTTTPLFLRVCHHASYRARVHRFSSFLIDFSFVGLCLAAGYGCIKKNNQVPLLCTHMVAPLKVFFVVVFFRAWGWGSG